MELKDARKLRAQTTSSLAARSESLANTSGRAADSDRPESDLDFQAILKKSRPYKKAAMKHLFDSKDTAEGAETPGSDGGSAHQALSLADHHGPRGHSSESDFSHGEMATAFPLSQTRLHTHNSSLSLFDLPSSHTGSSSSRPQGSSLQYSGWATEGEVLPILTPMTTLSGGSWTGRASETQGQERRTPLKVEVEGIGFKLMELELDLLRVSSGFEAVTAAISALKDEILRTSKQSSLDAFLRLKSAEIITYKTADASEPGATLTLNRGFLAGAIEELDRGVYARLNLFAAFHVEQPNRTTPEPGIIVEQQMGSKSDNDQGN